MGLTVSYTREEWEAEGERRFGKDKKQWRFRCPVCGVVTSVQEWLDAGAQDAIAFSCIGRFTESRREAFNGESEASGPCNYAGGGLFKLNPVTVEGHKNSSFFAFADVDPSGD